MKSIILIAVIGVLGCRGNNPPTQRVDVKYCISECMNFEFERFHNGTGFGGSSSMAGLHQTQIYDRVKKECSEWYADSGCFNAPDMHNKPEVDKYHSYYFGALSGGKR